MKNQWLDRLQIKTIQERKLRKVINHAYENVPYYKRLFEKAKIALVDIKSIEDLKRIPVTNKSDLQAFGPDFITSSAFSPNELKHELTSGSTGKPFTMHFDRDFVLTRDALFLRALTTAGYRLDKKLLLVTSPGKQKRAIPRWYYASILQTPEELYTSYERFKPDILYGCTTALKLLAKHVRKTNACVYRLKTIITTAEMLDKQTRCFLEETFDAELFDFYGLTEMGIIGWECPEHNGYHVAEDATLIEYLPVDCGGDHLKLIMTNLNLLSMPFIRFETGDIVIPGKSKPCKCGRGFSMLESIEGRIVDCVELKNGRTISPYRLTCSFEKVSGITSYQIIQEDYDKFTVKVEIENKGKVQSDEIHRIMHSVLGTNIKMTVLQKEKIDLAPGKKFRVIESKLHNAQN